MLQRVSCIVSEESIYSFDMLTCRRINKVCVISRPLIIVDSTDFHAFYVHDL